MSHFFIESEAFCFLGGSLLLSVMSSWTSTVSSWLHPLNGYMAECTIGSMKKKTVFKR